MSSLILEGFWILMLRLIQIRPYFNTESDPIFLDIRIRPVPDFRASTGFLTTHLIFSRARDSSSSLQAAPRVPAK